MNTRRSQTDRSGFTLIELLVVIGIIAILASILIPALQKARAQARRVLCGTDLHAVGTGLRMYGNEFRDRLPEMHAANWLWDLSYYTCDQLMSYGCDEKTFYCPCNPIRTNQDSRLWQYTQQTALGHNANPEIRVTEPVSDTARQGHFRVTGYCWLIDRAGGRPGPIINNSSTGAILPKRTFITKLNVEYPEEWELVTDTTISAMPVKDWTSPNSFSNVPGGGLPYYFGIIDRSNHLDGDQPEGGQILFADSHVQWREFAKMNVRFDPAGAIPPHWW